MKRSAQTILAFLLLLFTLSPAYAAGISFKTTGTNLKVGDSFRTDLILTGGENTLGTDMVLNYDPKTLEVSSIKESSLYPNYQPPSAKRIDSMKGKIVLSGSANISNAIKSEGVFATLSIKAIKSGQTKLSFDYAPGATNKTGIIDFAGNELLTSPPKDLILNISSPNPLVSIVSGILSPIQLFIQSLFGKK